MRQIHIYLYQDEYDEYCNKVIKSGLNKSQYIRQLINDYEIKELPPLDYYKLIGELNSIGNNLNQIARIANTTGVIDTKMYTQVVEELRQFQLKLLDVMVSPEKKDSE